MVGAGRRSAASVLLVVIVAALAAITPPAGVWSDRTTVGSFPSEHLGGTTSPLAFGRPVPTSSRPPAGLVPDVPSPGATPANLSGPTAFDGVAIAYDPILKAVVAVDANFSYANGTPRWGPTDLTWEYKAGSWSHLSTRGAPPPLLWPSMTYDAADRELVLFGGAALAQNYTDVNYTYTFANGTWTNTTSNTSVLPPALELTQMTFDAADGYVLLHGGFNDLTPLVGTDAPTWTFRHGNWTNLTNLSRPAPPRDGWMSYDPADGYVVFFGGTNGNPPTAGGPMGNYYSNATWEYLNGTWSNLTSVVQGAPPARARAPLVYDGATKKVLLFGGQRLDYPATADSWNDSWSYSGHTWTLLSSSSGVSPRENMLLTYDASDGAVVGFGGFGTTRTVTANGSVEYVESELVDTWSYAAGVWTPKVPLLLANRGTVDAGTPIDLTVVGAGPSFAGRLAYIGLPEGCDSASLVSLACSASQSGLFYPAVELQDPSGSIAWASTILRVNPSPSIASFTVSQNDARVGTYLVLTVATIGGTGPLAIVYSGLPPGCPGSNVSSLSCAPTAAGDFAITVAISDVFGESATSRLQLRILSIGSPVASPGHPGRPTVSPVSVPGPSVASPATFEDGLALGLAMVLLVAAWVGRRRALDRESSSLVGSLEESTVEDGTPPTSEPGRNSPPRGV